MKLKVADESDWKSRLWKTATGALKPTPGNVAAILTHDTRWAGVLAWDLFAQRLVTRRAPPWLALAGREAEPGPWQDGDDTRLAVWLENEYTVAPSREARRTALRQVAEANAYHPVREHLSRIVWDGQERLSLLFPWYFGAGDSPYLRKVSCWWLMGLAARVLVPGAKVDTMVVLEGPQGRSKSSALRLLALKPEWFLESKVLIGERDGYQLCQGVLLIEFAELSSWNRTHRNDLKQWATQRIDSYFPRYGEQRVDRPREYGCAGSTNDEVYLDDPTGARRFWPVRCGTIQLAALELDRDQLWAEALHYVWQGLRWWPLQEDEAEFSAVQEDRQVTDSWQDEIAAWLRSASPSALQSLTTGLIAQKAIGLQVAQVDRQAEMRIAACLRRLGYRRQRQRIAGERSYVYVLDLPLDPPPQGA